ncbi:MAG: outer membrane protein assembly factor BamD [Kiritimatiellia bacterium]|nr:outer membrane protein assembly factor BamD [Kiritimatiellia bacterium]
MKRMIWRILVCGVFCAQVALAADASSTESYRETEGRRPWYSGRRPAMATPAAQLEHARNLRHKGSRRTAVRQYRALVASWPASPEAALAQWEVAQTLDERGKADAAFEAYGEALDRYAGAIPTDPIVARQFDIARQTFQHRSARWMFGGFSSPERAIPLLESLLTRSPQAAFAAEAQMLLARAHEKNDEPETAAAAYGQVVFRYPQSEWAEEAAYRRSLTLYRLSERSPNDTRRAEDALHALDHFLRGHPDSPRGLEAKAYRDQIQNRRIRQAFDKARHYDSPRRSPAAALAAYRLFLERFPDTPQAEFARERVRILTAAAAEGQGAL